VANRGAQAREVRPYRQLIYEANRATIGTDPDRIRPGMVLQLPPPG
jgi:nucleoid-associated protein YgaU